MVVAVLRQFHGSYPNVRFNERSVRPSTRCRGFMGQDEFEFTFSRVGRLPDGTLTLYTLAPATLTNDWLYDLIDGCLLAAKTYSAERFEVTVHYGEPPTDRDVRAMSLVGGELSKRGGELKLVVMSE